MSSSSLAPKRSLGAFDIFFLVVAAAAPLAAIVGNGALGVLLGNGVGMPGSYLVAGLVLILFAVGFVRMSPHVQHGGAFYAYVRHGLGRYAGGAAAFVAIIVYVMMVVGSAAGFGFFASLFFAENLGLDISWKIWAAVSLVIVALIGYREITMGARLLAVMLILEVLILVVLAMTVFSPGSAATVTLTSFAPSNIFSGSFGIGLMFAFVSFLGFESAAIYSEEAKGGHRTVSRALIAAVIFIAVFYAIAMWSIVLAFGDDKVVAAAAENPGTLVFRAFAQYTHPAFTVAAELLMATSALAATIALHNAASRYLFALGREGMLPKTLSKLHPQLQSPHVASISVTVATSVLVTVFALCDADPLMTVLSSTFGLAALGIILLQAATSLSMVAFTWKSRSKSDAWAGNLLIAILATIGLAVAAVLVIVNYSTLTGSLGVLDYAPWLVPLAAVVGIFVASRGKLAA
ncbi:APC family permease [Rhizobium sp. KVB221]|uniref:APC family permease n=1 Tax=Rhizobium setariae TaxID=2801340 RepID=A0A936YLK0_9HYPH|nr:APC family permease [Rhizobium setariae]MBL0372625.1 APC family permease [Rhizobium setariae]